MKRTAKTILNYRKAYEPFDEGCYFLESNNEKHLTLESILKDLQLRIEEAAMSNDELTVTIDEVQDDRFEDI